MFMIRKVVVFFVILALTTSELQFSIYKLECIDAKDSNYTKNISCFLKTISRGQNALTTFSDLVAPIPYIHGQIEVLQKSSSNSYRNVIINNSLEICSLLGDDAPPLMKFTLPLLTKFAPDLVRPCPYEGKKVGVENLPIDLSLLPLVAVSGIPKGDYRVDVTFRDKWGNMIHWLRLFGSIQQKRFNKKPIHPASKASPKNVAAD